MDPISITGTVLAITAKCLTTARTLYTLREKYKDAQLTITAIYSESRVIGASLSHIQSIILESPEVLHSNLQTRPELESIFDHALTGCMLVFSVLDEEVEKLNNNVESAWNRATAVWKEDTMKDLLQQIRGQQIAISLLIQVLQMLVKPAFDQLWTKSPGAVLNEE
jgi:hypothetical protein